MQQPLAPAVASQILRGGSGGGRAKLCASLDAHSPGGARPHKCPHCAQLAMGPDTEEEYRRALAWDPRRGGERLLCAIPGYV